MTGHVATEPLLEREQELRTLAGVLDDVRTGSGRTVTIEAEAGVGKTRLLAAARVAAAEAGVAAAGARATDLERDQPFGLVRQLAGAILRRADGDREALLAGAAGLVEPLLTGAPVEPTDAIDTEGRGAAILHGFYWFLANAGERQPLVLLVDDVQWADDPSLRFLALLAARLEELPVALVVALRSGEADSERPLVLRLLDAPLARRLRPRPLSAAAVGELVRAFRPGADEGFAAACHDVTGGNPFYLGALLEELASEGIEPTAEAAATVRALRLTSVSRSVLARLAGLTSDGPALARALAVLGDGVELPLAARFAGLDVGAAGAAADALARASILADAPSLAFAHPIVRQAVYGDLAPHAREAEHRRAAAMLASDGAPAERVAAQLMLTAPHGDPSPVATLRGAADGAMASGAPEVAAGYLKRALAEPPLPADEPALRLEVAVALDQTGDPGAEEALQRAHEVAGAAGETEIRTRAALLLARVLFIGGRLEEAYQLLDATTDELPQDSDDWLTVEASLVASGSADAVWRERLRPRFPRLHERAPDASTQARRFALAAIALEAAMSIEPADEVAELGERALAGGKLAEEERGGGFLYMNTLALSWADRLDTADSACRYAIELSRQRGSIGTFAAVQCFRSQVLWRRGDLAEAVVSARDAIDVFRDHSMPIYLFFALAFSVDALVDQGELDAAQATLEEWGQDGEIFEIAVSNNLLGARGRLRIAQGRLDEGIADLLETGRRQEKWRSLNPATMPWRSEAAVALAQTGDPDRARSLVDDELERTRRFGAPRATGMALAARGLVNDDETSLREAVDVLAGSQAQLERGRALIRLGALLRRHGRRADAAGPLRDGQALAAARGARLLEREAAVELSALGARSRSAPADGAASLTPSERRICSMAAEGMSNREIAQALFVTLKTVETHLRNAYRKLDIESRAELGRALGAS